MYSLFDCYKKYSGNKTTIKRLSKLLQLDITKQITNNSIGINAYNFGTQLRNIEGEENITDYIVVLGGTDVYDYMNDNEKEEVIRDTLDKSKWIVSFNRDMKERIINKFSIQEEKCRIIPQSVSTKLKSSKYDLYETLGISRKSKIFLMVGNLRPVKRPNLLFNYFESKKKKILVIIGKMTDDQYVFPKNVFHINGLREKDVYACMKQASGLINCSVNEGMAISILEAMALRCPVYAFKNPGNTSLIKDNYNGYLFSSEKDFSFIIKLPTENIIKNAFDYVAVNHSKRNERNAYLELLE